MGHGTWDKHERHVVPQWRRYREPIKREDTGGVGTSLSQDHLLLLLLLLYVKGGLDWLLASGGEGVNAQPFGGGREGITYLSYGHCTLLSGDVVMELNHLEGEGLAVRDRGEEDILRDGSRVGSVSVCGCGAQEQRKAETAR